MRKKRKQKVIFSHIEGVETQPSFRAPASPQPEFSVLPGPEEVPPPPAPELFEIQREPPPPPPEAEAPPSAGLDTPAALASAPEAPIALTPDVPGPAWPKEAPPPPGPESAPSSPGEAEVPALEKLPAAAGVAPAVEAVLAMPDPAPEAGLEEVPQPPAPEPFKTQDEPPSPLEREAPRETSPAPPPVVTEYPTAPAEESLIAPGAGEEVLDAVLDAAALETLIVPEATGPKTFPEEPAAALACDLKLTDESLDFHRVVVGDAADLELAVANEGNAPGVLTDLGGLPAAGFSLVDPPGLPLTLEPGGLLVVTLRFSPDSGGQKTAALSLAFGGQEDSEFKVGLAGEAARAITTPQGIFYSPVFNPLGMSFVYIAPGSFLMGSPEDEPGRNDDEKQHEVTLSRGFYLQSTPVTHRQWQALMGDSPTDAGSRGNHPVANISWPGCQEFIQRLNRLEEGVYRLPTEAEWEYACRAGGPAALGDRELTMLFCESDPCLEAVGWYCGNADKQSHPVALKHPNAWELYDMHGNVMEWCQDWYGAYPADAATDPTGVPAGAGKVVRGGSWFSSAKNCRAACRAKWAPNSRSRHLGFRLVKEIE